MREDLSVDYDVWDLENEFSPIIAACLWCGIDHCKESSNQSLKSKVLKMAELLEKAAEEGKIKYARAPKTKTIVKNSWVFPGKISHRTQTTPPKFTRAALKSYAERIGQRPLFLFPEDRRLETEGLSELDILTIKNNVAREAFGYQTQTGGMSINNLELFDALSSHPKIIKVSRKLFADGHYAQAIFEAFKAVNNAVKKKSGVKDKDGQALMAFVFNEEKPILKLNSLRTQSDKDEQIGFKLLYMGAMTGIRNPKAHDHVLQTDPLRTLKYLAFASLLMERIDEGTRTRRKARSTGRSANS